MALSFTWDPQKASGNWVKHRVSFQDVASAFADLLSVTIADPDHSVNEDRFILIGLTPNNRLLVVAYVEQGDSVRIIDAGLANRRERLMYEEDEGEGAFP